MCFSVSRRFSAEFDVCAIMGEFDIILSANPHKFIMPSVPIAIDAINPSAKCTIGVYMIRLRFLQNKYVNFINILLSFIILYIDTIATLSKLTISTPCVQSPKIANSVNSLNIFLISLSDTFENPPSQSFLRTLSSFIGIQ